MESDVLRKKEILTGNFLDPRKDEKKKNNTKKRVPTCYLYVNDLHHYDYILDFLIPL